MSTPSGEIVLPERPPDDSGAFRTSNPTTAAYEHAVWYPGLDTPGFAYVRRWEGNNYADTIGGSVAQQDTYYKIHRIITLGEMGLQPVVDGLGFRIHVQPSTHEPTASERAYTDYALHIPSGHEIMDNASELEYPPELQGRMRITTTNKKLYSQTDVSRAAQAGVTILSLAEDGAVRYHDIVDHLLADLAFSKEHVGELGSVTFNMDNHPEIFSRFRVRGQNGLWQDFMNTTEHRRRAGNVIKYLGGDIDELSKWAALLDVDIATVRGMADRARQELAQLSVRKRVGSLSLAAQTT